MLPCVSSGRHPAHMIQMYTSKPMYRGCTCKTLGRMHMRKLCIIVPISTRLMLSNVVFSSASINFSQHKLAVSYISPIFEKSKYCEVVKLWSCYVYLRSIITDIVNKAIYSHAPNVSFKMLLVSRESKTGKYITFCYLFKTLWPQRKSRNFECVT